MASSTDSRERIDSVESWLSSYSYRLYDGHHIKSNLNNNFTQNDSSAPSLRDPDRFDTVGDYLHEMALSGNPSISAGVAYHPPETFVNAKSRELVDKMRIKRVLEVYDALDRDKRGFIDLSDIDSLLSQFPSMIAAFLNNILVNEARSSLTLSKDSFVATVLTEMNQTNAGPLSVLLAQCRGILHQDTDIIEERLSKFTFRPSLAPQTERIIQAQRQNAPSLTPERRAIFLSNERAMWGQRRDALERKKEAEDMAQCTFTPNINQSRYAQTRRRSSKLHFMTPIRPTSSMLTSEELEILNYCTFSPVVANTPDREHSRRSRAKSVPLK